MTGTAVRDFLGIACMPLVWAVGKAWDLLRGFDCDAEYEQIKADLREDLLRRGEGT